MKRLLFIAFLATCLNCHAQSLVPDSFSNTWHRADQTQYLDTNVWFSLTTYVLTNNFIADTDGVSTQNLTGVGVDIRVGDVTTNLLFHATVASPASSGLFSCAFSIPTPSPVTIRTMLTNIQLTLTNNAGTRVTFSGSRQLQFVNPLH